MHIESILRFYNPSQNGYHQENQSQYKTEQTKGNLYTVGGNMNGQATMKICL